MATFLMATLENIAPLATVYASVLWDMILWSGMCLAGPVVVLGLGAFFLLRTAMNRKRDG